MRKIRLLIVVSFCLLISMGALAQDASLPLSSWNDTATKQKIVTFVESVSNASSPLCVPEEDRIAVFDLDGTLFCEKPMYLQVMIAAQGLKDLAEANPDLRGRQPYKAAFEDDIEYLYDHDHFVEMNLKAFEGKTEEEYQAYCLNFLKQNQPRFKVPYLDLFYVPMLELLEYLRSKDFIIYIVSGSPQEFIRSFSKDAINIEPRYIIGETISIDFRIADNKAIFERIPVLVEPDVLREGKPINIRLRVGQGPILAFGNSSDDMKMLEYATVSEHPSLSLTLHHDDAAREYAYDKGAEKILETARNNDWIIVSMKDDFARIFEEK